MATPWRKYYTQVLDNNFLMTDNSAFIVFMKLVAAANSKGEYQASGREMAALFNLKYPTSYKTLQRLEEHKMITIFATPRGKQTIIKITNWSKYQARSPQISRQQSKQSDMQDLTDYMEDSVSSEISTKGASGEAAGKQPVSRAAKLTGAENALRVKNKNKNINTTNVVLVDEQPEQFGKAEINAMFAFWEQHVGYAIEAQIQANRRACSNLLKKHGQEKLQEIIMGVVQAKQDRYGPRISDFTQLQYNFNKLMDWGFRLKDSKPKLKGTVIR